MSIELYGENVKNKREVKGINQRNFAKLAGISNSYLCEIEQGKVNPSNKIVASINKALLKLDLVKLQPVTSSIENTLKERGATYGHFPNVAYTSQTLRNCMTEFDGWDTLNDTQREALTVIAQKISRILNGNPDYIDNWHDIAGYATLVEKSLV